MPHREGEEDRARFKSERFFCINNQWFFTVRENPEPIGPFDTKAQAEIEAEIFIRRMAEGMDPFGTKTRHDV